MALSLNGQASPVGNFSSLEGAPELSGDLVRMSGIGLVPFLTTPSPGDWFGFARNRIETSTESDSQDSKANLDQKHIRNTPHLNPLAMNPVSHLPQDLITTASDLDVIELMSMSNPTNDTSVETELTAIDLSKAVSFNMNKHLRRQLSFEKIRNSLRRRAPLVPFPRPSHPLMYSESSVSTDDMPVFYKHTFAGMGFGTNILAKGIQMTIKIPASLFPGAAHCQGCRRWYHQSENFESCGQFCNDCSKWELEALYSSVKEMENHVPWDMFQAQKDSRKATRKEMGWFRKRLSWVFGDKEKSRSRILVKEKPKTERQAIIHHKQHRGQKTHEL